MKTSTRLLFAFLGYLLFLANTVAAQATTTTSSAPSATTSLNIVQTVYAYNPSKPAAGIFAALFAITTFVLFVRLFKNRTWWGLCLPIGSGIMAAGFALRIEMVMYPNSQPFYLCSSLFILLSPAAFLAFNYILYGKFIVRCVSRRHSLIRPERTARYFVISDFTTIFIQGAGGGFLVSTNATIDKVGFYMIIAGLALQTLSFGIYILLVVHVLRSLKRGGITPSAEPWGPIFKLIFFTSACFLIRCIYRTIEFAQGLGHGYLVDHEVFFYVFDSVPLFIGITMYAIRWPSVYLVPSEDKTLTTPMVNYDYARIHGRQDGDTWA